MEEPHPFRQSTRKFARALRRGMTKSETMLWQELRANKIGPAFRRQLPIGPYVVDFACPAIRLVVELDGRTHEDAEARGRDATRQAWLEREGWRVIRFTDAAV